MPGEVATVKKYPMQLSEAEWRARLSEEEFRILRRKGTEYAFTGALYDHRGKGVYTCAGCGEALFSSDDKFDSGSGWPSYDRPIESDAVDTETDTSHGMVRTEVMCANCGGHLGHVFPDGPRNTTGQRYCINSASLRFDDGESDDGAA